MSSSNSVLRPTGFTLLELLVVVLLVSLLASLLMQGFIYLSGVYSTVARRQAHAQQQELLEGWVRDSIQSLTNGLDSAKPLPDFSGDAERFGGISLRSIARFGSGEAIRIEWLINQSLEKTQLIYSESPVQGGDTVQYVIREWPGVSAQWRYWDGKSWLNSFPERTAVFNSKPQPKLPLAIALYVDSVPNPIELIVTTRSSIDPYLPPMGENY